MNEWREGRRQREKKGGKGCDGWEGKIERIKGLSKGWDRKDQTK